MSVQLILYPQGHNGTYNAFSNPDTDFIVNGNSFINLSNAPTATGNNIPLTIITNPATVPNSWYLYKYGSGSVYPSNLNGNLILPSDIGTTSGIYQRVTGITFGMSYDLIIDIITPPQPAYIGTIKVYVVTASNTAVYNITITQAVTQVIRTIGINQFGQTGLTDATIFVGYSESNTSSSKCTIGQIQLQPSFGLNGSVILDDGQVICDLYEDEDLPLTLSVDEFKNVAEKVQSYSKAFNLPATKRNNQIFDQVFEVTRHLDGGSPLFNPYQKTQCVLKQDGFILFEGYLRMLDITDKDGEISYNVNLYSEVIALADYLKERTFSDLDFTELEHDYNKNNIKDSWNDSPLASIAYLNINTSGFRDAYTTLRYPFIDWNHQFIVGTGGTPELPSLETAFRPWVNVKYLIDRIFENTPFTYTSVFLNTADISKLYMDFNWGADNAPVVFNSLGDLTNKFNVSIPYVYTTINFEEMAAAGGNPLSPNFGYSGGAFTAQEDGQVYTVQYAMDFDRNVVATGTLDVQWLVNGVPVNVNPTQNNDFTYFGSFTTGVGGVPSLLAGDTILCQAKASTGSVWQIDGVYNSIGGSITPALVTVSTSVAQTTTDTLLGTLRGETGQWDFLKGLITMFNLVTMPDEMNPDNIKIEPYSDIFIDNTADPLNWTDKVDASQMKLEPLTDLNKKTMFKFVEDDDDYAFNNYKKLVEGHLYGSKLFDATDEFNILDGEDEVVAEPFAASVVKPLMAQYPNLVVPAIYSLNDDGVSEGFDNSPRIMYNSGIQLAGTTYKIPAQNGFADENQSFYLKFGHVKNGGSFLSAYQDFHFGECQLLAGTYTLNNLFNLYWLPYFNELYNINTRTMSLKVNLNPSDISTFQFNRRIVIKNREFRVNKINYQPNDLATVEFILIP
tara:strand:+ start:696 stop:3401 length:2706 start_codon:yes stop_codon:yes gene_type:complete